MAYKTRLRDVFFFYTRQNDDLLGRLLKRQRHVAVNEIAGLVALITDDREHPSYSKFFQDFARRNRALGFPLANDADILGYYSYLMRHVQPNIVELREHYTRNQGGGPGVE